MDFQKKISKLSKTSNYVSKLPVDNRINELLKQELKCKQKIKNKQLHNCKLKKKDYTDQD